MVDHRLPGGGEHLHPLHRGGRHPHGGGLHPDPPGGSGQGVRQLRGLEKPGDHPEAAEKFGSQCVVVAMDVKRRPEGGWTLYLNGGRIDTGKDALEWAREAERLGAGEILLTSMDCDGTKNGYDLELTRAVSQAVASR